MPLRHLAPRVRIGVAHIAPDDKAEKPSAPPASVAAAPPKRGLGRPPGSPNKKPQDNGYDVPPSGLDPEGDLGYG